MSKLNIQFDTSPKPAFVEPKQISKENKAALDNLTCLRSQGGATNQYPRSLGESLTDELSQYKHFE